MKNSNNNTFPYPHTPRTRDGASSPFADTHIRVAFVPSYVLACPHTFTHSHTHARTLTHTNGSGLLHAQGSKLSPQMFVVTSKSVEHPNRPPGLSVGH